MQSTTGENQLGVAQSNLDQSADMLKAETASNHQMDQQMIDVSENNNNNASGSNEEKEELGCKPNPDGFFADTGDANACSVRVALRVRPLIGKELRERSAICVQTRERDNEVIIGKDRVFTYDKCFGMDSRQDAVFESCVKNLVLGCFVGFNATILAYGQTGSGKTFTMGSGYIVGVQEEDLGIIPRVIKLIFDEVEARKNKAEVIIKCSFLEIYNEELHDLLDSGVSSSTMIDRIMPQKKEINVREEKNGTISVYGLKEMTVKTQEEMAKCLDIGSSNRSVAATLMNSASSRSHGIFTITIEQHLIEDLITGIPADGQDKPEEYMMAKFHFVDLAGSERAKKTGASGGVLKEGININKSLLALGNVISSLTDPSKNHHVPYRDSKLTRILQDSLGGNSRTVMMACCSPAETNYEETLNTLKYAARARAIKNKPIVNRDPASQQIAQLRQQVYELQKELLGFRKLLLSNDIEFEQTIDLPAEGALDQMGKQIQSANKAMGIPSMPMMGGGSGVSSAELSKLEQQISELKAQVSMKTKECQSAQSKFDTVNDQHQKQQIQNFDLQKERDLCRFKLESIVTILKKRNLFEEIVKEINGGVMPDQTESGADSQIFDSVFGNSGPTIIEEYQLKVEEQTKELNDLQVQLKQLQTDNQQLIEQAEMDLKLLETKSTEIEKQKRQVSQLQNEKEKLQADLRKPQPRAGVSTSAASSNRPVAGGMPNFRRQTTALQSQRRPKVLDNPDSWISSDLENKLKNFDEMRQNFIEQLTNQMSSAIVPSARHSVKITGSRPLIGDSTAPEDSSFLKINDEPSMIKAGPNAHHSVQLSHPMQKSDQDLDMDIDDEDEDREGPQKGGDQEMDDQEGKDGDDSDSKSDEEKDMLQVIKEIESGTHPDIIDQATIEQDKMLEENIVRQTDQMKELEVVVKDKEVLLDTLKNSQKELQDTLLAAMKEEYHKRIQEMNEEMVRLERDKDESLRKTTGNAQKSKIEDMYKQKSNELKLKLKELEAKQREQQKMKKSLNQSELKVKSLSGEIEKMKTQKVTMMKKIKEESDNHAKLKKQRVKEIANYKKQILKSQREMDALKRDNRKKDIFMKRKAEELKSMQQRAKMDEHKKKNAARTRQQAKQVNVGRIREWIMENIEKMVSYQFLQVESLKEQQECQEIENLIDEEQNTYGKISLQCEKQIQRKSRLSLAEEGTQDDEILQADNEIQDLTSQMQQVKEYIESLEDKQKFIAAKITQKSKQIIELQPGSVDSMVFAEMQTLEGARACIATFFQILLDCNIMLRDQYTEIDEYKSQIELMINEMEQINTMRKQEEQQREVELQKIHQEYCQKERKLVQLIVQKTGLELDVDMNSQDDSHWDQLNLLELIDVLIKQVKAHNDNSYESGGVASSHEIGLMQKSKNETLKKALASQVAARQEKKENFDQTKAALSRRNVEIEKSLVESQTQIRRLRQELQSANIEKVKYKRLYDEEKRKRGQEETVQSIAPVGGQSSTGNVQPMVNYRDARNRRKQLKQNKSISGTGAGLAIMKQGSVDGQPPQKAYPDLNMEGLEDGDEEPTSVFHRLQGHRKTKSNIMRTPRAELEQRQNWNVIFDQQDAHKSQIYCLTSVGNQLYSTANRSLKIWDIETMKITSDLPDKIGLVKAIVFWKERNLLLTAAERAIKMWDVVSLTNVGVFTGFKEEIKALHLVPEKELVFAASKGSANGGGLLIYDPRKSSNPIYEREKSQDVFSLTGNSSHVYYGTRKHTVNPFCLNTFNSLNALHPPHLDVVTSLALLGGGRTLVSGSRDKFLRLYDLETHNLVNYHTVQAHNDHINTLETDSCGNQLYSGSKDGIVKVWSLNGNSTNGGELSQMAQLEGNAQRQPVNTICKLNIDESLGQAFACGSADKSIRIYKMSLDGNPGVSDLQNEEMKDEQAIIDNTQPFTLAQQQQLNELDMLQLCNQGRMAGASTELNNNPIAAAEPEDGEGSRALEFLNRRKQQKAKQAIVAQNSMPASTSDQQKNQF